MATANTGNPRTLAEEYLEKIVQIPFRIPEQRLQDIGCYVSMLCLRTHLSTEGWDAVLGARSELLGKEGEFAQHLIDWVSQNGAFCSKGTSPAVEAVQRLRPFIATLAGGLRGNPRQIKRFLNILEMRERLARANNLKVDPGILIKLLVIEYTWRNFFENVVETFDPATGNSELIEELEKALAEGEAKDEGGSPMLAEALLLPGLSVFVKQEPKLSKEDLNPYLYLSQTALHGQRPAALAPPEERARTLIERIACNDRIASRAAARRAAKEEGAIVSSVVRGLLVQLSASKDMKLMVHIVEGLTQVCGEKNEFYAPVAESLGTLNISDKEPVALAAMPLLQAAKAKGIDVNAVLEKFTATSPITKALSQGRRRG